MKYSREIKVGLLAILAIGLLYFGFNFLKGVNIFSSTNSYLGKFSNLNGLVEQSPVYVRGYKVGQVDKIIYNFADANSFTVHLSVHKDIVLPEGTRLALIQDGLLNGSALELQIPLGDNSNHYVSHDTLPTCVVPGLIDNLQDGLLGNLSRTVEKIDSVVAIINSQLEGDHLKQTLSNVETISSNLRTTSADLKVLVHTKVPSIINNVDTVITDIKVVSAQLSQLDIPATMNKVDGVVEKADELIAAANSKDGTLGLLLNDKDLYVNINNTITSADSLLVDLKAHPKRYVHFSLFGKKDK